MFHYPAWAEGSYSDSLPAGGTLQIQVIPTQVHDRNRHPVRVISLHVIWSLVNGIAHTEVDIALYPSRGGPPAWLVMRVPAADGQRDARQNEPCSDPPRGKGRQRGMEEGKSAMQCQAHSGGHSVSLAGTSVVD